MGYVLTRPLQRPETDEHKEIGRVAHVTVKRPRADHVLIRAATTLIRERNAQSAGATCIGLTPFRSRSHRRTFRRMV